VLPVASAYIPFQVLVSSRRSVVSIQRSSLEGGPTHPWNNGSPSVCGRKRQKRGRDTFVCRVVGECISGGRYTPVVASSRATRSPSGTRLECKNMTTGAGCIQSWFQRKRREIDRIKPAIRFMRRRLHHRIHVQSRVKAKSELQCK
jgi:hypothetical protein